MEILDVARDLLDESGGDTTIAPDEYSVAQVNYYTIMWVLFLANKWN
jgi:hypothetical protein